MSSLATDCILPQWPPAIWYERKQVLRLLRRPTHTPSRAGLVQYASYTTKCPGTTSGLSGKQATHDGVQALPPVGTGPAHKGCLPDQRNGVTRSGDNPATQQVSRNCHPPQTSYATKRPGTGGNQILKKSPRNHQGTFALSWTCAGLS